MEFITTEFPEKDTAVALGVFPTLQDAAKVFVKKRETYYPNEEYKATYDAIYQRYKQLYGALRPIV